MADKKDVFPEALDFSDTSITTLENETWYKAFVEPTDVESGRLRQGTPTQRLLPSRLGGQTSWIRRLELIVYGEAKGHNSGLNSNTLASTEDSGAPSHGLDLSNLRVNFRVEKHTQANPNLLYARIYNLDPNNTYPKILQHSKVALLAGYKYGLFGVIFKGTVVQYVRGKENSVDTYLDIHAGDGDEGWSSSVMNLTFPKGTTLNKQAKNAVETLIGITPGTIDLGKAGEEKTLRAHTVSGPTRHFLHTLTNRTGTQFWIDEGVAHIVPMSGYLPSDVVELSPQTGLVGIPRVTPQGIEATCLLNPRLRLGGRVKIESTWLSNVPYEPGSTLDNPWSGFDTTFAATQNQHFASASLSRNGVYIILLLDHHGDTRGTPWYSEIICQAEQPIGGNAFALATMRSVIGAPAA